MQPEAIAQGDCILIISSLVLSADDLKRGEENMSSSIMSGQTMETAPFDPRFPNQNQTKYCYQSYVDFHRCQKLKGEDYEPCQYFKRVFTSMCPVAWVEKWDEQLESNTFPGKI